MMESTGNSENLLNRKWTRIIQHIDIFPNDFFFCDFTNQTGPLIICFRFKLHLRNLES